MNVVSDCWLYLIINQFIWGGYIQQSVHVYLYHHIKKICIHVVLIKHTWCYCVSNPVQMLGLVNLLFITSSGCLFTIQSFVRFVCFLSFHLRRLMFWVFLFFLAKKRQNTQWTKLKINLTNSIIMFVFSLDIVIILFLWIPLVTTIVKIWYHDSPNTHP